MMNCVSGTVGGAPRSGAAVMALGPVAVSVSAWEVDVRLPDCVQAASNMSPESSRLHFMFDEVIAVLIA